MTITTANVSALQMLLAVVIDLTDDNYLTIITLILLNYRYIYITHSICFVVGQ